MTDKFPKGNLSSLILPHQVGKWGVSGWILVEDWGAARFPTYLVVKRDMVIRPEGVPPQYRERHTQYSVPWRDKWVQWWELPDVEEG